MAQLYRNHQPRKTAQKAAPIGQTSDAERRHLDELLDEGLKETFPASDAVAVVQQPPERPAPGRRRRAQVSGR